MNRRMTFGQYRTMDLTAFAIMLIASESVIQTASTAWFPGQPYTVSVTAAITAIVLMRWKKYAALHAVLGGLVFCFHLKAGPNQYLIYCLGNLGAMLLLPVLRKTGDERIRNDALMSILFALCTQVLMQAGRAAAAAVLGASPAVCFGFFTTDALSVLFTMVIVWIARRLDGIFEDQKKYLLRVQEEKERGDHS